MGKKGDNIQPSEANNAAQDSQREQRLISLKPSNKLVGIGLLILLIVALLFAGYYLKNNDFRKVAICSEKVLLQANPNLLSNKVDELRPTANAVEKLEGYQEDPNCVYIVLSYYIYVSDAAKASENYGYLTKVHDPKAGYSPSLGEGLLSDKDLGIIVAGLEKSTEQIQSNATFGPGPGPGDSDE